MVSVLKIFEVLDLMPKSIPMSEETSKLYLQLLSATMHKNEQIYSEVTDEKMKKELNTHLPISIFIHRAEGLNIDITIEAAIFLGLIAERPGVMILYLAYIAGYVHTHKIDSRITLKSIGMELFPMGFFDDQDLHHAWLKQKRERKPKESFSDNWLDTKEAWEPLIKK